MPSIIAPSQTAAVLFCWNCGKPLHTRSKFCSACGEKLDLALPEPTIAVQGVAADVDRNQSEKRTSESISRHTNTIAPAAPAQEQEIAVNLNYLSSFVPAPGEVHDSGASNPSVLKRRGEPILLRGIDRNFEPPSDDQTNQPSFNADLRPHPWFRYWARMTDVTIYFLMVGAAIDVICSIAKECGAFQGPIGEICIEPTTERLLMIPAMIIWWFIEAFFISRFSATFGKWLFGIRVTEPDGKKLSYKRALTRTFNMWCYGLGCSIPCVTLFYQVSSLFREENHIGFQSETPV